MSTSQRPRRNGKEKRTDKSTKGGLYEEDTQKRKEIAKKLQNASDRMRNSAAGVTNRGSLYGEDVQKRVQNADDRSKRQIKIPDPTDKIHRSGHEERRGRKETRQGAQGRNARASSQSQSRSPQTPRRAQTFTSSPSTQISTPPSSTQSPANPEGKLPSARSATLVEPRRPATSSQRPGTYYAAPSEQPHFSQHPQYPQHFQGPPSPASSYYAPPHYAPQFQAPQYQWSHQQPQYQQPQQHYYQQYQRPYPIYKNENSNSHYGAPASAPVSLPMTKERAYVTLGFKSSASRPEFNEAFNRLAAKHSDEKNAAKNEEAKGKAQTKLDELVKAYEYLDCMIPKLS